MHRGSIFATITLSVAMCGSLGAQTLVSSDVTSDTTWNVAGSPWVVPQAISVRNGATLTIEAGVEVRFGTASELRVGTGSIGGSEVGFLHAVGTTQAPITFTSNQSSLAPGDWRAIVLHPAEGSTMMHCVVEYGGALPGNSVIVRDGDATIMNTTIRHGATTGLLLDDTASIVSGCVIDGSVGSGIVCRDGRGALRSTISGCTISNNGDYPVRALAAAVPVLSGNTYSGNASAMIVLEHTTPNAAVIAYDMTLPADGLPYHLTTSVDVGTPARSVTLTVEAGVELRVDTGRRLTVGENGIANLLASGTALNPI